jgi:acetoin utilization deacetylase AcuC-like enzyme
MTTAYLFLEKGLEHDTGPFHPECADRLSAIQKTFKNAGIHPAEALLSPAKREDVLRVHSAEHIDTIQNTCQTFRPYNLDADTVMSFESWDAALLAAGCCITACKGVLDKTWKNAFCAIRPPGHHAERGKAMGFCLFNNVAIAAQWLRHERGLKRVAILDWDVHHGNGTQNCFYDDDSVYYASIHQSPHFPGTGFPHERGKNNTNLNCAMLPDAPADAWLNALDTEILPEFARFQPDFLLISAGFDAHRLDPLGHQNLEDEHFVQMTQRVRNLAGGKVVSLLEGGYNLDVLGGSALSHFKALRGAEGEKKT